MPFRSYEQMAYLKHNEPKVYARWVKKYGKKIKPKGMKKGNFKHGTANTNHR